VKRENPNVRLSQQQLVRLGELLSRDHLAPTSEIVKFAQVSVSVAQRAKLAQCRRPDLLEQALMDQISLFEANRLTLTSP
jgi:hypothetical protein